MVWLIFSYNPPLKYSYIQILPFVFLFSPPHKSKGIGMLVYIYQYWQYAYPYATFAFYVPKYLKSGYVIKTSLYYTFIEILRTRTVK